MIGAAPPIDVLWFRLSRREADPEEPTGYLGGGKFLILINRGDYWQIAYVIPKGADRTGELQDWGQVRLLSVQVDRLKRWYRPGMLCIGDAAHAMSPVGGVSINLTVQDAVTAANALAGPLREGKVET